MIKIVINDKDVLKNGKIYELDKFWDLIKQDDENEYIIINNQKNINDKVVKFTNKKEDITKRLIEEYNVNFTIGDQKSVAKYMDDILNEITYYGLLEGKSQKSIESLLTVGNGYQSIRGSLPLSQNSKSVYNASYICGLYNKVPTKIGDRLIYNEDFVNIGNINTFELIIDNKKVEVTNENTEVFQTLNLKEGILYQDLIYKENQKKTKINVKQFVSFNNISFSNIEVVITPLNYLAQIDFRFIYNTDIRNLGIDRYKDLTNKHLDVQDVKCDSKNVEVKYKTNESKIDILIDSKIEVDAKVKSTQEENFLISSIKKSVEQDEKFIVCRSNYIQTSNNMKIENGQKYLDNINKDQELLAHIKILKDMYQEVNIRIKGDNLAQRLVKVNTYHLLASLSPQVAQKDISMTARGLHGEAYRGHIFWDEIFIMPYYLTHFPKVAKTMIMYRYKRLQKAQENAKIYGYDGAMFPWQSGRVGDEQTQLIHLNPISGKWDDDYSSLQRHVSLAIAYNILNYYKQTSDEQFLEDYGFEMLEEITKFWISKTEFNEDTKKYSIDKVMGPDEFHEKYPGAKEGGIRDNSYTNVMVSWLIQEFLNLSLKKGKKIDQQTRVKWENISHNLNVVIQDDIIAQYDGYFELKELDFDYYKNKYKNIYRMDRILKSEGKDVDNVKVAKQADVLMLFYLFDFEEIKSIFANLGINNLTQDMVQKNLNYYLKRTTHGSTLSRIVHSLLAQQVGEAKLGYELYLTALSSDYIDIQGGTTAEGIHTGVMASSLYAIYLNYAGIDFSKDKINFNLKMPTKWKELEFKVLFKGSRYDILIKDGKIKHKKI